MQLILGYKLFRQQHPLSLKPTYKSGDRTENAVGADGADASLGVDEIIEIDGQLTELEECFAS